MNIFSNIGITELIVILLLALLVVGPERLPEVSRKLAKGLRDVRQAYENITKDLGPELMSIQETTREIRDSVDSVRSIPKDVVGSVIKAADLEDTIHDLKEVEQSIQEAGKSVTQAGQMVRKPLDEVVETTRGALKPGVSSVATPATDKEAATAPSEPTETAAAPVTGGEADQTATDVEGGSGAGQAEQPQAGPEGAEGEEQTDD